MMSSIVSRRLAVWGLIALACFLTAGCGGSQKKSLAREQSGLKKLAVLYGRYLAQHRGQPPGNEGEFRKFVQSLPAADRASLGIDDAEGLFLSNRDNKPYVIIYGRPQGPPGPGGSPVIAYEQDGKSGKRWVASALGAVEEVDDARFKQLTQTGKH